MKKECGSTVKSLVKGREYAQYMTAPVGLSTQEAKVRLEKSGSNVLDSHPRNSAWKLLIRQFESPIILILFVATVISMFLGEVTDVVVGDLVALRSGDLVPANLHVVQAIGLMVDESALTGEPFPRKKNVGEIDTTKPLFGILLLLIGAYAASDEIVKKYWMK